MHSRTEEQRLRLFVAIEMPEAVREALARLQLQLRREGLEGLRWVRPESIHLTLKFLGETAREQVEAVQRALREAVHGSPPFQMVVGAPGTFSDRRGPRVLWVDLKGDLDRLQQLQQRVEEAMTSLGFPREERPFSPHITLARVRPETARSAAPRIAAALRDAPSLEIPIEVREVSLMRSTLQPEGAVYHRLAAFPLG